jgi:hypothetical protein
MWMASAVIDVSGGLGGVWVALSVLCEVPEKEGSRGKHWKRPLQPHLVKYSYCTVVALHGCAMTQARFACIPCTLCWLQIFKIRDLFDHSKKWVLLLVLRRLLHSDCCRYPHNDPGLSMRAGLGLVSWYGVAGDAIRLITLSKMLCMAHCRWNLDSLLCCFLAQLLSQQERFPGLCSSSCSPLLHQPCRAALVTRCAVMCCAIVPCLYCGGVLFHKGQRGLEY